MDIPQLIHIIPTKKNSSSGSIYCPPGPKKSMRTLPHRQKQDYPQHSWHSMIIISTPYTGAILKSKGMFCIQIRYLGKKGYKIKGNMVLLRRVFVGKLLIKEGFTPNYPVYICSEAKEPQGKTL